VDDTPRFLKDGEAQDKWKVVSSDENLGVIKGRNLGAKCIENDFFLNIDNDQFVQQGWLENLFQVMNENNADIVGPEAWTLLPPKTPGATNIGSEIIPDRSYFPYRHCENRFDKFSYIGCGGSLIRREVYDKIGLFDEIFNPAYFEDPDFSWRAMQAGFKLGWSHNCPIQHLAHQTFNSQSLFNKSSQFIKSWKAFRKKWLPYFPEPLSMESIE
jgi:GT2 family glycosyltransferase